VSSPCCPILPQLAAQREVVAVDLPGFGETPPTPGEISIARFADELTTFLHEQDLSEVDMVGSSMGARVVLEMAGAGSAARCAATPTRPRSTWRCTSWSASRQSLNTTPGTRHPGAGARGVA
jgi:pimeloyl-ACP methyl ester carboxylesterase